MLCLMNTDERTALGARVEKARTAAHMGKEAAARKAGISAITWKRVEDGLRVQDVKLAAVLGALEPDKQPAATPTGVLAASDDALLAELAYRLRRYAALASGPAAPTDLPATAPGISPTGTPEPSTTPKRQRGRPHPSLP